MFDILLFLEFYQQHPCLWDKSHSDYKDRQKRNLAEKRLLKIFKFDNVKALRAKIRSIRGTYNNEIRKLKTKSMESGLNEIYKPKLSWFEYANTFLCKNQELESVSETNLTFNDFKEEKSKEMEQGILYENFIQSISADTDNERQREQTAATYKSISSVSKQMQPIKRGKRAKKDDAITDVVNTLKNIQSNVMHNEFMVFGNQIGIQLNKLPLAEAIVTQQQIQTIITEARLKELHSRDFTSSSSSIAPSTPLGIVTSRKENCVRSIPVCTYVQRIDKVMQDEPIFFGDANDEN